MELFPNIAMGNMASYSISPWKVQNEEILPMLPLILYQVVYSAFLLIELYGKFLTDRCKLNDERATPAVEKEGAWSISLLLVHQFCSGIISLPLPGLVPSWAHFGRDVFWMGPPGYGILVGAILVGGVHDFGSTLMSVRNGGRSIADTMRGLVGEGAGKLFMLFVVLALVYVIIVFLDLTANTFAKQPSVATASGWFIAVAIIFGISNEKWQIFSQSIGSNLFFLTFAGLAVGHLFPMIELDKEVWIWLTLGYCFVAAVLPVGLLLQPRDFLSAGFLYAILGVGALGMTVFRRNYPDARLSGWESEKLGMLVPFLFITVACGACSGFHSIVSSGTTSKQIKKRRVACPSN